MIGIGLIGYGYWGPNLARVFSTRSSRIVAICEKNPQRAEAASFAYPGALITDDYKRLLSDPSIQAILIATPVGTHFALAKEALEAGKDVLVEKPMTVTTAEAKQLIEIAKTNKRILAVDHTFLFTGAVQEIKRNIEKKALGELTYFDSVRINLGLFNPEVNVVYDLAAHDLSILFHLIDEAPSSVIAMGSFHAGRSKSGIEDIAYVHLDFPSGFMAHFHVSWVSPVKVRRTILGGTQKMIVYDDLEPTEKVRIYDKGIVVKEGDVSTIHNLLVDYRAGDVVLPKLSHHEALSAEAKHFIECIETRKQPLADGRAALRVVQVLEAAQVSIKNGSCRVPLEKPFDLP